MIFVIKVPKWEKKFAIYTQNTIFIKNCRSALIWRWTLSTGTWNRIVLENEIESAGMKFLAFFVIADFP